MPELIIPAKYNQNQEDERLGVDSLKIPEKYGTFPGEGYWSGITSGLSKTGAAIKQIVTGGEKGKSVEDAPEFRLDLEAYAKDPLKAVKTTAGMLAASTDEGRINIIKKNYPEFKVYKDRSGNDIIETPEGERAVLNRPGMSGNDLYQTAYDIAWFIGPGRLAKLGKGPITKGLAGAAGGAIGETTKEATGMMAGSEERFSPGNISLATAGGGLAEGIPATVKGVKTRAAQRQLGIEQSQAELAGEMAKQAKRADVLTEKTGIELGRAQKTRGISDAKRMSYVAQLPAAEQKAMKFLEKQNKQAYRAVSDLMDTIAPAESVGKASRRTRKAAQEVLSDADKARATAAKPYYDKAFADENLYSPNETISFIDDKLAKLPEGGERKKTFESVKKFFGEKDQTIEQLNETKIELDGMIEKARREGSRKLVSDLREIKGRLLKEVDELNPDYKEARRIYSDYSPKVTELEESTIGTIANKKDTQIKTVARELFEPDKNLFDPEGVKKARMLIAKKDPEAWNGILRAEWQRRLGKARIDPADLAASENVPAKLRSKIFGMGKEREALYSAMSQEQKKNARYLEEALKRAEKGRPGGSPTAANQAFERELRGVGGTVRRFLSRTRETIAEAGQDAKYDKNVRALADVMFDPKWQPRMKSIRRLTPESKIASAKFKKLIGEIVKSYGVSQSPDIPEAAQQYIDAYRGK